MVFHKTSSSNLFREKAEKLRRQAASEMSPSAQQALESLAYGWEQMALRFNPKSTFH